ncbi:peptidase S24 [Acinetobacter cumulans]|uniref:Peptidase S24 n=1 Tax=Acinetobacter cumulans TaxID=2136182 RepID=A0A3A8FN66_9GAMM|nr:MULTISPECIES: S24 family peptidase [Acinetobacter]RKG47336.1 peptidase S24 [Acinetobacter cumulans]WOE40732.1 S24 family peptidase [Acinetobacter chinensis]
MNYLQSNIEHILDRNNTNPNDLEQKHPDIKQSTLFRIANGITKNPRWSTLEPFAKWAGVSVSDLIEKDLRGISSSVTKLDNNVDLSKKIQIEGHPIPVISWVAAGSFSPIETVLRDAEVDEYLPPIKECGKNGYGLIVTGNSMLPKFEPDDRLYVNPDFQVSDLRTNDLVIVACAGSSEATFKKITIEGENMFLEPLNPDWPEKIIKMAEDSRLVGKVVGQYRKW